jgi:hypothetical protein
MVPTNAMSIILAVTRDEVERRAIPAPCLRMTNTPSQSSKPATPFRLGGGRFTAMGRRSRHVFATADLNLSTLRGWLELRRFYGSYRS